MKYINAKDLLPDALVKELQRYMQGGYLYIPADQAQKKRWGEASGYRQELPQNRRGISKRKLYGSVGGKIFPVCIGHSQNHLSEMNRQELQKCSSCFCVVYRLLRYCLVNRSATTRAVCYKKNICKRRKQPCVHDSSITVMI